MRASSVFVFIFFIALSLAAGAVGALFTLDQIPTWYATLTKPSWTPPSWVFGPVWNTLYVLMGVAAALVWGSRKFGRVLAIWIFIAQLVVNALWSIVFFALHEILLSVLVIGLLWILIIVLFAIFWRHSRIAAFLLVPYFLWVSYAATLNVGILLLN
ncbi:MAG TPA: TspO/MBR family protein [Candidatus Paceibacterota bacterium]|nr:TspO/MBR family protein [Candidatus Paceibacterota bacterium]